ncbi:MAG TPA: ABC transporter permease subunit [Bacteroidia bacterium]|nr:ABC transporter permease subunit [Bacteroidia bacterium]HRS57938.1 ABC transporter permease subunit [Bacteroidia bacterium]HRU67981.1 ABC transporter permease subunit [Bacteroidia bacterium]
MTELVKIELFKIFSRGRTYIGIGAIVVIVLAIITGVYLEGQTAMDFVFQSLKENFIFQGNLINAYFITHLVLNTLWIHVPILVALVTGDLIAGEANSGTFRLILTRPVSRTKLLAAKFFAGWIYTISLVLLMAVLSLGLGIIVFGKGDLIVFKGTINIFEENDILWRFAAAFGYGIITMTAVASFSFLLSAFAENSIGPIIGSIAIIIAITIITTVGNTLTKPINPYLFTTYLPAWQFFFDFEPNYAKIFHAIKVELIYSAVFLLIAIVYFRKKDILS